ncbi:hypothetical protein PHLGIDRAFT_122821 [Phlebiopsis gigantea 11061_1 CR5-6]|uniref:Uncharacterized protein n=1 Tax=Phlebiopsis gigantea (strain 11061_1 CR5-6) TaxID=745531 RepID=A0A0C3PAY6_PHLG1|nr:hypothetical protein PHLGIDRAFT_122821 [Phlebiopsis gigantea 11061_1 CR5-6]
MDTVVKKAFAGCRLEDPDLNLSQESLESRKTAQLLRTIEQEEPEFWAELRQSSGKSQLEPLTDLESDDTQPEDPFADKIEPDDNVDVPIDIVKTQILSGAFAHLPDAYVVKANGTLVSVADECRLDGDWSDMESVDEDFDETGAESDSSDEGDESDFDSPPPKRQQILSF